jgi:hypothetical protein
VPSPRPLSTTNLSAWKEEDPMRWTISRKLWLVVIGLVASCLPLLVSPFDLVAQSPPASPGDVVISEVAWGGTAASPNDEWIELYNTTPDSITLTGWSLAALDGTPAISLVGVIPPGRPDLHRRSGQRRGEPGTLRRGRQADRHGQPRGRFVAGWKRQPRLLLDGAS